MIDPEIFAQQVGLLAGRIGRELEGPVIAEYYRQLSNELTTEQFVAAMMLMFNTWSAEFRNWPSPRQIVEAITPVARPSLSGAEAFEKVLRITNDPRIPRDQQRGQVQALGATVARAFRAAGEFREFTNVLELNVVWLKRSFIEAFDAACESAEAERAASLALASADERVAALVRATTEKLPAIQQRALPPTGRTENGSKPSRRESVA